MRNQTSASNRTSTDHQRRTRETFLFKVPILSCINADLRDKTFNGHQTKTYYILIDTNSNTLNKAAKLCHFRTTYAKNISRQRCAFASRSQGVTAEWTLTNSVNLE